jgi:hypothetical protein
MTQPIGCNRAGTVFNRAKHELVISQYTRARFARETYDNGNHQKQGKTARDSRVDGVREMKMRTASDCLQDIKAIRSQYGTSIFDDALRTLKKERLENYGREPKKRFPPKMYQRLYDFQGGLCAFGPCRNHLNVPAKKNEIDHIDPNRQDLNHPSNLQLLHPACNRIKASRTLYEQSKLTGQPISDILKTEDADEQH